MTPPDLPAALRLAVEAKLQGVSRADITRRAAAISGAYRAGGNSGAIASESDALAYALVRMPATYAALGASLNALVALRPDFAPKKLIDVGAGPGTATWAAAEAFSSLHSFVLLDAPCPHDRPCPLQSPDWCHFAQRLPRLRAHMQAKGVELPFEDEKYSYVVLTRVPPARRFSRVLSQPTVGKADVTAKLCTSRGLEFAKVPRRDKTAYARARRWRWGDLAID